MQRGNGAVIGKQNTPTTSVATGVWALNEVQRAVLGGTWPSAVQIDPYFEYNTLMLHGNGTNGAQNNTFLDSSTNNFTITRNGNTTQGTFTPYGSNWGNFFPGTTGTWLTVPNNAAFQFGTGDFTIEAWIFLTGNAVPDPNGNRGAAICGGVPPGSVDNSFWFQVNGNSTTTGTGLALASWTGGVYADVVSGTFTVAQNTWNHVAATRSGNTTRLFLNGVLQATNTYTGSVTAGTSALTIGYAQTGTNNNFNLPFPGYISNLRIVKGSAVYTSAFTPSTAPLTAITNTSLLTCQSNRFIDNSTNNFTITRNGDVSVQRFSPFNPTAAYSAATIGGSGYFDGTGDYLSATMTGQAPGTGSFTYECWFYLGSLAAARGIMNTRSGDTTDGFDVTIQTSGNVYISYSNTVLLNASVGVIPQTWYHLAIVRNGSTNWVVYLNGASIGTISNSSNFTSTTLFVGAVALGGSSCLGYIADFRYARTAVYTAAFTPPSAPLTAIANTAFLASFTNGGIFDNAMMNDLETVGNAQISTSVSKFGGGSIYLDGTGDNLTAINRENFNFGTGDFTVEFWINASASGTYTQVVGTLVSGTEAGTWRIGNRFNSTNAVYFARGNGGGFDELNAAVNVNDGAWHHVAVTRASGTVRIFVDGTLGASSSITGTCSSSNQITIGYNQRDNTYVTGYIDDLRITKGYARYTANFTAPTAPFPDQ